MNAVQHILILGVRLYRVVLSPAKVFLIGPLGQCRFQPTCSAYALEAIARHGALRGGWLALKRVGRCHPWGCCGDDPVPSSRGESDSARGKRSRIPQHLPDGDPTSPRATGGLPNAMPKAL